MSTWPRALVSIGSLAGATMIAAVQVPPEAATSNMAAWVRLFGFNWLALRLPSAIDEWVVAFGIAVWITSMLIAIDVMRRLAGKRPERSRKRKARAR